LKNNKEFLFNTIKNNGIKTSENGTLLSGDGSILSWVFDLRPIFLRNDCLKSISSLFWEIFEKEYLKTPFQLAGIETSGIPLLTAIIINAPNNVKKTLNSVIIRKERKTYGTGLTIEGNLNYLPVIVIDDLINSASGAEKARVILANNNVSVKSIFTVIDFKSEKGLRWSYIHKIPVKSIFTLNNFDLEIKNNPIPLKINYTNEWKTSVSGGSPFYVVPKSAPLLVGDKVFRGCDAGYMHAFDYNKGHIIWEHAAKGSLPQRGVWASPAYYDGKIYYGSHNGMFYCLDAETGKEIWAEHYCDYIGGSALIIPEYNMILVGMEFERIWSGGSINAIDLNTKKVLWSYNLKKQQIAAPAYSKKEDLIIWCTADHETVAIKPDTGKLIWRFPTERSCKYPPTINEEKGLVAFASFDKNIYINDLKTGQLKCKFPTNGLCYSTPLFFDNKLFCGSADRNLYVIDTDNFTLLKKINLFATIYSSPAIRDNILVIGTSGGIIYDIDVDNLNIIGCFQLEDAVTNGVIFNDDKTKMILTTSMNDLYKYRVT
jgi:outer membrane protein assembly factor BamB